MRLFKLSLAALLLTSTLAFTAAPASAWQGPPTWTCVRGVTAEHCYWAGEDHDVCFAFSLQVPQCVDLPGATIDCRVAPRVCQYPTDPCAWGYFECVCNPSICEIGSTTSEQRLRAPLNL